MSKRILIYGGRGSLGRACVKHFISEDWWVANVDYLSNNNASVNIIPKSRHWSDQENELIRNVGAELQGSKLDAIVCVAGGFRGGNCTKNLSSVAEEMWKKSVWSSTIAASLAAKYLQVNGLLVLTGAKTALNPTPRAIGYGMAKAAIHNLTSSLAFKNSGLPEKTLTIAILPETLDTETNRRMMPDGDFNNWTPVSYVAQLFHEWAKGNDRPPNGSLVTIITRDNISSWGKFQIETDKSVCE